jgi:hypothetical protein
MTVHKVTEEQFLDDVADHRMTIIRDDGIYRHVAFKRPGTSDMHFDLITWPMCLCYTGDMGTYVFRRLEDMFVFFRTSHPCQSPEDKNLKINPSYWAEKLEAVDRTDGLKQYSPDKVRAEVKEWLDNLDASEELRQAVEDEVLSEADDQYAAVEAIRNFEFEGEEIFSDFFEVGIDEYTGRFIWCCYALAWGVQQYDAHRTATQRERNR